MNRLLCLFAVSIVITASLTSASPASFEVLVGDTVKLTDGPGGPGGIFHVDIERTAEIPDFDTFCVELTEHISLNTKYYVSAVSQTTHDTNKVLQPQAAWLFTQFIDGLGVSDWSATGIAGFAYDAMHANALQLGVWRGLQTPWTDAQIVGNSNWTSSYITGTLEPILNNWLANFTADLNSGSWVGTGDVAIMSLNKLDRYGNPKPETAQDQLVLIPGLGQEQVVPELPSFYTAGSVLACTAVVGLLLSQRKRRLAKADA